MKIYIAGPLFNEMERTRNEEIASFLQSLGHEVYLPQKDGGLFSELVSSGKDITSIRKTILQKDLEKICWCDTILCLLDGRVPDEGMCVELGIAYASEKKCIGYRTDSRIQEAEGLNIILEGVLGVVVSNKKDLQSALESKK